MNENKTDDHWLTRCLPVLLLFSVLFWPSITMGEKVFTPARLVPKALTAKLTSFAKVGDVVWAVGERGHLFRGEPTLEQQPFISTTFLCDLVARGEELWVVGHDALIAYRADNSSEWVVQHYDPGLNYPLFSVAFQDSNHGIAVGAFGLVLVTSDGGKEWRRATPDEQELHLHQVKSDELGQWYIVGEQNTALKVSREGELLERYDLKQQSSLFGLEVLAPDDFITYGLKGKIYHYRNGAAQRLSTECAGSIFGSLKLGDKFLLFGERGTIWTVHGDQVTCTDIGQNVAIMSAVVSGDELMLGTVYGLRKWPLDAVGER